MRIRIVMKFLGFLTFIISMWMSCPLIYSFCYSGEDRLPFAVSTAIGVSLAALLHLASRGVDMSKMRAREALACVALSWVAASAISALPFFIHGSAPTYTDAFFEAMSGYTTTGSTILQNIDSVPRGLLLWRALNHWLGGMGIIVLTLTVMPLVGVGGVGGFRLFSAEVPGMIHEKITPRVQQTAVILWLIYIALTLIQTALLFLGGMGIFDALTHSMGTISTGGFSTHNDSVAHFGNAYFDWVITFFMFISGANFALHFSAIKGRSLKTFFRDPEFAFYLASVSSICILVSLGLYISGTYESLHDAFRLGSFQTVSLVTTTGFIGANYEIWPLFPKALLFTCLFMGGCAGSTSGGIKQIRLLVMSRHAGRQFTRMINPSAVIPLRVGRESMNADAVSSCLAFFGLYMIMFVVGIFFITLYEPDLFTAISGVATTLGNVGPGFGSLGAAGNFASQTAQAKWIYSFLMLCGRLELFTVLTLFTRVYWSEGVSLAKD